MRPPGVDHGAAGDAGLLPVGRGWISTRCCCSVTMGGPIRAASAVLERISISTSQPAAVARGGCCVERRDSGILPSASICTWPPCANHAVRQTPVSLAGAASRRAGVPAAANTVARAARQESGGRTAEREERCGAIHDAVIRWMAMASPGFAGGRPHGRRAGAGRLDCIVWQRAPHGQVPARRGAGARGHTRLQWGVQVLPLCRYASQSGNVYPLGSSLRRIN